LKADPCDDIASYQEKKSVLEVGKDSVTQSFLKFEDVFKFMKRNKDEKEKEKTKKKRGQKADPSLDISSFYESGGPNDTIFNAAQQQM